MAFILFLHTKFIFGFYNFAFQKLNYNDLLNEKLRFFFQKLFEELSIIIQFFPHHHFIL